MKITVIHGQTHKGNTYMLTKALLDKLGDNEVTELYVNDIPYCVGCFNCITKSEDLCPHHEKIAPIVKAIDDADLIIIDTPNYCMNMTGQLKNFCDHMAYRWMIHRPSPTAFNKVGVAISTTAGAGATNATKLITEQMYWWGIARYHRISQTVWAYSLDDVPEKKKKAIDKKLTGMAKKLKREVGKAKLGIKSKALFGIMKGAHTAPTAIPSDAKYWKEQGWI